MSRFPDSAVADRLVGQIPYVRRYARSLARSPDDGDDLAQTALERALRSEHHFEGETDLRRWLFKVVRNAHIDSRRSSRRRGPHVPVEEHESQLRREPSQEHDLALRDLERGLDALKPQDRDILRWSVFAGLPHEAIAERLGIAVGTVKSRLSRTRSALRVSLDSRR